MQLRLDPAFDGSYWPGPTGGEAAAANAGEVWVGPLGLLEILETALGLGGSRPTQLERIAALAGRLRKLRDPEAVELKAFAASAQVDALAVARRLLGWREELLAAGWQGEAVSPRIAELAKVTEGLSPGLGERWQGVVGALESRKTPIKSILLMEEASAFSLLVRRALGALAGVGTVVATVQPEPVLCHGDLQNWRSGRFEAAGDGSLQLLRSSGPLAAAEAVSAWLTAQSAGSTIIIGGDACLDAALHRFGLPTTGSPSRFHSSSVLAVLPLVVGLVWTPLDPQLALELLVLPRGPVPKAIARGLVDALQEWPAVGSETWNEALKEGLQELDQERASRTAARLSAIFTGRAHRQKERLGLDQVLERVSLVQRWAAGMDAAADSTDWSVAVAQCSSLERVLRATGSADFDARELSRWLAELAADYAAGSPYPAQAGVTSIVEPGAVVGAVGRVIWWNFDSGATAIPKALPLATAEREALLRHGVELPSITEVAERVARRWRRPLEQCNHTVLCVCPERDEVGEECFPHPLWDEIAVACLGKSVSRLVVSEPISKVNPSQLTVPLRPLPKPVSEVRAPSSLLERPKVTYPTTMEKLIRCPLRYVLDTLAKVGAGQGAELATAEDSALLGSFAHRVLEAVFKKDHLSPLTAIMAEDYARQQFDELAPTHITPLCVAGEESGYIALRNDTARSARELVELLRTNNLRVLGVEQELRKPFLDGELGGNLDLLVGEPHIVIDLKLGGAWRRGELEQGNAYQLAAYAELASITGKPHPTAAYYLIRTGQLISTREANLAIGAPVDAPPLKDTWAATAAAWQEEWSQLSLGVIAIRPIQDDLAQVERQSGIENGKLRLTSMCEYCDFGHLCQREAVAS